MITGVIYARVSTEEQVNEGKSIEVQIDLCKKWAKENDCTIVGVYKDEGKTATTLKNRFELQDGIAQCQEEKVNVFLITDTDRLCRNPSDHFLVKASLGKSKTQMVPVTQPMITDTPEGNLIDTIMAGVNAFQSQITGRKVRKSLEKKCEEGWWPGWSPVGFINKNRGTIEKPINVIEVDPEYGSKVTEIFKLYSTNRYSVDDLVELSYTVGLRSKNGRKLCNPEDCHVPTMIGFPIITFQ